MKTIAITIIALATSAIAAWTLFASPAATQNWVKDYVSTNTTSSASVSNTVKVASYSLAGSSSQAFRIMQNGSTSNDVKNASQATVNAVYPVISQVFDTCVEY